MSNSTKKPIERCISDLWKLNEKYIKNGEIQQKGIIIDIYENIGELLLSYYFPEITVKKEFGDYIYHKLNIDENITESQFRTVTDILQNRFYENPNYVDDKSFLVNQEEFVSLISSVQQYFDKLIKEEGREHKATKITEILEEINALAKSNPRKNKELIALLEKEHNLFCVDKQANTQTGWKRYYYQVNKTSNTYTEINRSWLQQLFTETYGVKLHETTNFYNTLLERINTIKTVENRFVELENIYIDTMNCQIIDKKEKTIFTEDRLSYIDYKTNELRLFRYHKNLRLKDVLPGTNNQPSIEPSLAMENLIKILVPRTEPHNTQLLQYILQTIGMMIIGRNPAKRISVLYDENEADTGRIEGNSGKSTVIEIIKMIFDTKVGELTDKVLSENFIMNSIKDKHFLYMDELQGNEFIKHIALFKRFSSGYDLRSRETYGKQESTKIPPLIIAGNGVPRIPLHDVAHLGRYVLAKTPNVFKEENAVNPNKNEYPEVSNIELQIKQHSEGLSQVVSIALNEYISLDHNKSIKNQLALNPSFNETILIITKEDPVKGILHAYTEEGARSSDKNDWVTIVELQQTVKEVYKEANGIDIDPDKITPKNIGYIIKELYPHMLETKEDRKRNKPRHNGVYVYNITLKTKEEMEEELKNKKTEQSHIIEALPEGEHNKILQGTQYKQVYNKIKAGVNTEYKLIQEFKETHTEEEINEILEELSKSNLIRLKEEIDFV